MSKKHYIVWIKKGEKTVKQTFFPIGKLEDGTILWRLKSEKRKRGSRKRRKNSRRAGGK